MNEKMNDALEQIRNAYIEEAAKTKKRRPYWFAAAAAVLALVIALSAIPWSRPVDPYVPSTLPQNSGITPPEALELANLVAAPAYPKMAAKPNYDDYSGNYEAYEAAFKAWQQDQRDQYDQPNGYADSLASFFADSAATFLRGDKNSTYAPLNVYLALAMLAETTGGSSRQQILELLGLETIEALRQQASFVWNAHYSDDGETTLLMANSLWLDDAFSFHRDTVDTLASQHYASSFSGDLGTDALDQQLRQWLNANTGGLLQEQAENVSLDPYTVFALASTMYFTAGWKNEFDPTRTEIDIFQGYNKRIQAAFMQRTCRTHTYYRGSNFGAINLLLSGNNKMWLILPDKGYTLDDILSSDEYMDLTLDPAAWENKAVYDVNLSLPKFDIAYQQDLIEGMKALGVTDIFDRTVSDFTPMTDTPALYVGQINHAARVAIDEQGCIAAAFTVIGSYGTSAPQPLEEMDFVLDRPFLFVVSSRDHLPLFAGTVTEP